MPYRAAISAARIFLPTLSLGTVVDQTLRNADARTFGPTEALPRMERHAWRAVRPANSPAG
jgi:hypothetical protein